LEDLPDEDGRSGELPRRPAEDALAEGLLAEDPLADDLLAANVPPSWMLAAVRAVSSGPGVEDHGAAGPEEN
jgi:hypothetical protein